MAAFAQRVLDNPSGGGVWGVGRGG
jgi:hypothetical protein